jgi:response regulator of citrate/malate metabolism
MILSNCSGIISYFLKKGYFYLKEFKESKMLKCIGIDDEFSCNELLTEYCSRIPFVDLVATFTDPILSLPLIQSGELDFVFLDFYMSPMNAPAFLPHIPSSVKVVITTSELLSRIKDYELNVAEIITKPYSFERFLALVTAFNKKQKKTLNNTLFFR